MSTHISLAKHADLGLDNIGEMLLLCASVCFFLFFFVCVGRQVAGNQGTYILQFTGRMLCYNNTKIQLCAL